MKTFWYWESEVPSEKCQEFIESYFKEKDVIDGSFRDAETNKETIDFSMRKTDIVWVPEGNEIFNLAYFYAQQANSSMWQYDLSGMENVQIGRYTGGGHYCWHTDEDQICPQGYQRKLSISIQLSDEDTYEGGDLILKTTGGKEFTASRKQGSIVVFPSALLHQVTPVTKGVRYSAVSWMRGPRFR